MRILAILSVCTFAGCANTPETRASLNQENVAIESNSPRQTVELLSFEPREPAPGEAIPPSILTRLSGTLALANGCLAIDSGGIRTAIAFRSGSARFDQASGVLEAGGNRFALGDPISVGGPFTQPSAAFDAEAVKARCGVQRVWLVAPDDVARTP